MIEKLKKDFINYYVIIIVLIIYCILMQVVFKSLCPIKAIFGVNCPGCGLTHASIYLFEGRFHDAIHANYSVFFWWIFFIAFAIDRYVHPLRIKPFPVIFIVACIVTILRYIIIIVTNIEII